MHASLTLEFPHCGAAGLTRFVRNYRAAGGEFTAAFSLDGAGDSAAEPAITRAMLPHPNPSPGGRGAHRGDLHPPSGLTDAACLLPAGVREPLGRAPLSRRERGRG